MKTVSEQQLASFDRVARDFARAVSPPSAEYISAIVRFANLVPGSQILELGCGSGDLAVSLSRLGFRVTAVDISAEMLQIARRRDAAGLVKWLHRDVSELSLQSARYNLIFSFESFHLFANHKGLVRTLAQKLQAQGILAIGWCDYHWERVFENSIRDEFRRIGIDWGEWGYQRTPTFVDAVRRSSDLLTELPAIRLELRETSSIDDIALYLTSIDKAARLADADRSALRSNLSRHLKTLVGGNSICGRSVYFIHGCRLRECG